MSRILHSCYSVIAGLLLKITCESLKGPYKRSNLNRETFGRPLILKVEQAMNALREWQNNGCHSKKLLMFLVNHPLSTLYFALLANKRNKLLNLADPLEHRFSTTGARPPPPRSEYCPEIV